MTYKIKKWLNDLFFSKEPDWYFGLFLVLHFFLFIDVILNRGFRSLIEVRAYYPLPLFEFFHIPDSLTVTQFIVSYTPFVLSHLEFLHLFKILLTVFLVLSFLGVWQRFFIAGSLIGCFLFLGWYYGYIRTAEDPYVHHSENICFFIFLVWLFAPLNPRWTLLYWLKRCFFKFPPVKSYYPSWPRLLVILTIALVYFGSFYCKWDTSGWKWIDGYTLQAYLLSESLKSVSSETLFYGSWLANQNFYFIWFLNIGVWLFQSTAFVGFLIPKTRLLYAIMGVVFHISVQLFMGINFTPFKYYYVVFIPELFQFFKLRLFLPFLRYFPVLKDKVLSLYLKKSLFRALFPQDKKKNH